MLFPEYILRRVLLLLLLPLAVLLLANGHPNTSQLLRKPEAAKSIASTGLRHSSDETRRRTRTGAVTKRKRRRSARTTSIIAVKPMAIMALSRTNVLPKHRHLVVVLRILPEALILLRGRLSRNQARNQRPARHLRKLRQKLLQDGKQVRHTTPYSLCQKQPRHTCLKSTASGDVYSDLVQEAPSVLSKPRPRMEGQSMPLRSLDQRGKGRVKESIRRRSLPSFVWGVR